MRNKSFYQIMFTVAAAYDILLGAVFFLFYKSIFTALNIPLPENPAYAHLIAAFVFAQGISYGFIYFDLKRNIDIVKIGVVNKSIYTALTLYYAAIGGLPHLIFAFFGIFDFIFAALFALYLRDYKSIFAESV